MLDRYDTSYKNERVPTNRDKPLTPREADLKAAKTYVDRKARERLAQARAEILIKNLVD